MLNEKSIQLFLNLLIHAQFPAAKCWVQFAPTPNKYFLPTKLNYPLQQVLNPKECNTDCNNYILHDPISTSIDPILIDCYLKDEFRSRAIVFTSGNTIHKELAHFSITVEESDDLLRVYRFADWAMTIKEDLNYWNLSSNKFLYPFRGGPILTKKINNSKMLINSYGFLPPAVINQLGTHNSVLKEYAKFININWKFFQRGDNMRSFDIIFYAAITIGTAKSIGVNQVHLGFIVPKEKIEMNFYNTISVFSWQLWVAVFLLYCIVILYFGLEKQYGFLFNLLLLQPPIEEKLPRMLRAKCVYVLVLFFQVLFVTMYGSAILKQLLLPRYTNVIRSWEDMDAAGYPLYWHDDPRKFYKFSENPAEQRVLSRRTGNYGVLRNRQTSFELHLVTQNKFSSLLYFGDAYIDYEQVRSVDDVSVRYEDYIAVYANGSLHMNGLNHLIRRSTETGLMYKWEWEAFLSIAKIDRLLSYFNMGPKEEPPEVLSVGHLIASFSILVVGVSIAFVVFLLEMLNCLADTVWCGF